MERERLEAEGFCKNLKSLPALGAEEQPFEVPDGWLWVRLAESLAVVTDGDHLPPPKTDGDVPLLHVVDHQPREIHCTPAASHAEVLPWYPLAVAAEPIATTRHARPLRL